MMTESNESSPYLYTLRGLRNGQPHEIVMDVKEQMARRAEASGHVLTETELHEQSMQFISDMERTREAAQRPASTTKESGVQKLATRVTSLFSR